MPASCANSPSCSRPSTFEVLPQSAFDVPEADEPHVTFVENAIAKARHAARLTGLPALADDSGLCVSALGGAPGVHRRAMPASDRKSDARNNAKLLAELQGKADRRAHYVAVLVLMRHGRRSAAHRRRGRMARRDRRHCAARRSGFGYDPLLFPGAGTRQDGRRTAGEEKTPLASRPGLAQLLARLRAARDSDTRRARPSASPSQAGQRRAHSRPSARRACRRWRSTCTGPGACASAPTATSIRTRRATASTEAAYLAALIADLEAALPRSGTAGGQRLHRRRHAQPDVGRHADALLAAMRMRLPLLPDAEITLEANPGTAEAGRSPPFAPPA
jgi:XTP/dITP diphosphohydrolase